MERPIGDETPGSVAGAGDVIKGKYLIKNNNSNRVVGLSLP